MRGEGGSFREKGGKVGGLCWDLLEVCRAGPFEGERGPFGGRVEGRLLQLLPSCRFHPRTLVHLGIDYHLCSKQTFSVSSKCEIHDDDEMGNLNTKFSI